MRLINRIRTFAVTFSAVELWVVAAVVAVGAVSARVLPFALGLAAFFWLVRWLAFGRLTVRTPGDWALGLLVLMLPVTLWATALPEVTWPAVLRVLAGIALFYSIVNWASSWARLWLIAMGLVVTGLSLALLAPVTVDWSLGKLHIFHLVYQHFPLLLGSSVNANVMGGSIAFLSPLTLAFLVFDFRPLDGNRLRRRGIRGVATGLLLISLLVMLSILALTQSRGAYMGAAMGLGLVILLRWPRFTLGLVVLAAAGAGFVLYHFGPKAVVDALLTTQTIGGLDGRLEIWSRALYMIQDFSFTGIGMGSFQKVANLLYPFFIYGPNAQIPHAHNLFLQVAVDLGIPGFIAWLSLLLLAIFVAWRVYWRGKVSGDRWLLGLGAGLLGSQAALVVHGLTDAVIWGTRPAVLVWAVWGLAMAAHNLVARRGVAA